MTEFERTEIMDYKQVWFLGLDGEKIEAGPHLNYNYGFDDERGDYKTVMKDHLGFRFAVLGTLGRGSFGQALKCLDHKTKELVALKIIRNKKKFQH